MRICSRCKKPSEFHKSAISYCKVCDKEIRFLNRDKITARMKRYYQNNRDKIAAQQKRYRMNNQDKITARQKRYILNNRPRVWCRGTIVNHRRRRYTVEFTPVELFVIAKKTSHCGICECKLTWISTTGRCMLSTPTLDRINDSKTLTLENTQIICMQCNTTKGSRTMKQFISYCAMVAKK